jgi:hypothetical protein
LPGATLDAKFAAGERPDAAIEYVTWPPWSLGHPSADVAAVDDLDEGTALPHAKPTVPLSRNAAEIHASQRGIFGSMADGALNMRQDHPVVQRFTASVIEVAAELVRRFVTRSSPRGLRDRPFGARDVVWSYAQIFGICRVAWVLLLVTTTLTQEDQSCPALRTEEWLAPMHWKMPARDSRRRV